MLRIIIKLLLLSIFFSIIKINNEYKNKKKDCSDEDTIEMSFSEYRSILCLFLFIYAFINVIATGKIGFLNPYSHTSHNIKDLNMWFEAYLIFDLIIMINIKTKRIDLWIHHIVCIITILIANYKLNYPFIINFVLLCESMSILSGIDFNFVESGDMYKSMLCKKVRKNIIKYLRFPIWITVFLMGLINFKKDTKIESMISIVFSIFMIFLDQYWSKKCTNVIKKYS